MSSVIKIKRRLPGAGAITGAPTGGAEGEIALNFAGGATATPELWANGGTGLGWLRVNPAANITTQSVNLGTAADIGTAYTAWAAAAPANKLTGNVVIAQFTPTGGVVGAYVLTNPAAPGVAGSWVSLGGAVSFATSAQAQAGTDTVGALNSAVLAGAATNGSTAPVVGDAGKYVRVDANGKIAAALLPVDAVNLRGAADPKATVLATIGGLTGYVPAKGDSFFLSADGPFSGIFTGIASGTAAKAGDRIIYDGGTTAGGTGWHLIPNAVDLSAYLALAGGTMANAAVVNFGVAAGTAPSAPVVRLNGSDPAKSAIDGFTLDMGTF